MVRLLIVDDSEDLLELYGDLLTGQGYEVDTAIDGEMGLQRVLEFRPDVVLLDMMMPDVDGLEFLARLPGICPESRPRVIANSGFDRCREEALRRGAHVFLRKPVERKVLLAAIADVVRNEPVPDHRIAENERQVDASRQRSQRATLNILAMLTDDMRERVHSRLRALVEWVHGYYGFGQCFLHLIHGEEVYLEAIAGNDPQYMRDGMLYPRSNVYCDDVIDAGSTLYISDPLRHPVPAFSHHNEVRRRGWHFYIGAPLVTEQGAVLGTLCLMDRTPRELHQEDVRLFEVLAQHSAGMLADVAEGRPSEHVLIDDERVFHPDVLGLLVAVSLRRVARSRGKVRLIRFRITDVANYASVIRKAYGVTSGLRFAVSRAPGDEFLLVYDGDDPAIIDNNTQALELMVANAATPFAKLDWSQPESSAMDTARAYAVADQLLAQIAVAA
jgi:DNA-binding response OmpR family regulator